MMVVMAVATSHDPSSRGKPSGVLRIGVTVGTLGLHRKSCSRGRKGGAKGVSKPQSLNPIYPNIDHYDCKKDICIHGAAPLEV